MAGNSKFVITILLMRYFLLYRSGQYFILTEKNLGIIGKAIAQACTSIASVHATSETFAIKILMAAALSHHMLLKGEK